MWYWWAPSPPPYGKASHSAGSHPHITLPQALQIPTCVSPSPSQLIAHKDSNHELQLKAFHRHWGSIKWEILKLNYSFPLQIFFKKIYLLLIRKKNKKVLRLTTGSFPPTTHTGSGQVLTGNRATKPHKNSCIYIDGLWWRMLAPGQAQKPLQKIPVSPLPGSTGSCGAPRTSLPGRCDLFGSWASPPGELPSRSVKAKVTWRQLQG